MFTFFIHEIEPNKSNQNLGFVLTRPQCYPFLSKIRFFNDSFFYSFPFEVTKWNEVECLGCPQRPLWYPFVSGKDSLLLTFFYWSNQKVGIGISGVCSKAFVLSFSIELFKKGKLNLLGVLKGLCIHYFGECCPYDNFPFLLKQPHGRK